MKIEIRPSFAILLGLLIALDPARLTLPFLLAAALHEAGHLICLRFCRVEVFHLRIGFSGAVLYTAAMTRRQEALSAASGPAVNLLCGVAFAGRCPVFSRLSLLLAGINLLPVFPLDGGRILSVLLPKSAAVIGTATAAALVLGGCFACAYLHMGLWPLFLPSVLLAKATVWYKQEQNLIAKSGFAVYNIQRSR